MSPDRIAAVRDLQRTVGSRLLGATLGLDDDAWHAPSLLPGWTRGHIGTHLARNAEALARVVGGVLEGTEPGMYDSTEARNADIEGGAGRDHLSIQEDMDQATYTLVGAFDQLSADHWQQWVTMRPNMRVPVAMLPLGRVVEVVLHHIDLGLEFTAADLDDETAAPMLDWLVLILGQRPGAEPLTLTSTDGASWHLDTDTPGPEVTGSPSQLVTWLTGRGGRVDRDDVTPPAL